MPRNGSGVYSLPQPPFVPNTVISSSAVNSDFSDIGAALTGSLARDGQGGMTGALLAIDGTVGAPGISFVSDPNTGIRRVGADEMAIVAGGADALTISGTAATFASGVNVGITGALSITGTQIITATVSNALLVTTSVSATIATFTSTEAGAGAGPNIVLDRNSATPLANDTLAVIALNGRDSGGNSTSYTYWIASILDPTNGSEDGRGGFNAMVGGADTRIITYGPGVQIGAPAGGDMGTGTINATGIYINGAPAGATVTFSANKGAADQAITTGIATKVTFTTEEWDVGNFFASSTFTPPSGRYELRSTVTWTATGGVDNESLLLMVYKNGAVHRQATFKRGGTGIYTTYINTVVEANGTDTFEVYVQKGGAGNGNIDGTSDDSWFQGNAL